MSPLNLSSENNKQFSKHEPVIYYTEAIKDFEIADKYTVKDSSTK